MSSIERVIGPSLKRLSEVDIEEDLKSAYRDNKKIGRKIKKSIKKSACIADDVRRIINATPEFLVSKAEEATLWLFSLYTGARSITATAVCLKDISWVDKVLRFNLRVTKGNNNWNHSV